MNNIYKYRLSVTRQQIVIMPDGAVPLDLQLQNDEPTLWAVVDTSAPPASYEILMLGTGTGTSGLTDDQVFLGTVQQGPFVWHFFARKV